jgi:hypothetical protein
MSIEAMMYFALGALASALVMLAIMPAVWRRAVRLTRKRMEAATPLTLAEFRADKDLLRAEFALATRRLETNIEQLRRRLAGQLGDKAQEREDLARLTRERDGYLEHVQALEAREAALTARVAELERDGAALRAGIEAREQALAAREEELAGRAVRGAEPSVAGPPEDLAAAEGRLASAESRFNDLLRQAVEATSGAGAKLLAEQLSHDGQLAQLRDKVKSVEKAVLAEWGSDTAAPERLRERLADIASDASRLVYAVDDAGEPDLGESLFDRVQRFADASPAPASPPGPEAPPRPANDAARNPTSVSDRMAALRELRGS